MRATWCQSTRPKLNSRLAPRESILSRGPTANPLWRRPGFNDFFTVFLAPVLAAATIANLSWKEKQKKDWETKFAQIDREIELLRAREQEIWARIQLQSIRRGIASQRRYYSTTAAAAAAKPDINQSQTEATERTFEHYDDLNPLPLDNDETSVEQGKGNSSEDMDETTPAPPEDPALQRFERLIAYRLALQMLLQVHVGGNPKYGDIYQLDYFEDHQLPHDLNTIVRRLRDVASELASMKSISAQRLRTRPSYRHKPSVESKRLNNQLHHLGNQYKAGNLKINNLVERFATIIMHTPAAPDIRTYTSLIHLFNYVEKEDFSYLVLSALMDSSLFLDKIAVHTLLWRYGRSRDIGRFDNFLKELTKTNARVRDPWEWRRVDGNLIPVPSSFSSLICTRLISVALTCDQPDRAQAWASLMAEERPLHIRRLMIMKHFLQYYASRSNWEKGRLWIAEAIEFGKKWDRISMGDGGNPYLEMQLTALRMLNLCTVCGKEQVYSTIFQAAIDTGIDPPVLAAARPQFYVQVHLRIIQEWSEAYERSETTRGVESIEQRVQAFAEKLGPLAEELSREKAGEPASTEDSTFDIVFSESLASKMEISRQSEVIQQQQTLIKTLQDEIALSSRSVQEERRRLGQSQQRDLQIAALHQEQIDELRQELAMHRPGQSESEYKLNHKIEAILSQQNKSIEMMQKKIEQLTQLLSNPSKVGFASDEKDADTDSGYGSDSAPDPSPSSPTPLSTLDPYSDVQARPSEAPLLPEDLARSKPFYVQRLHLENYSTPQSSSSVSQQVESAQPRRSRPPFERIEPPESETSKGLPSQSRTLSTPPILSMFTELAATQTSLAQSPSHPHQRIASQPDTVQSRTEEDAAIATTCIRRTHLSPNSLPKSQRILLISITNWLSYHSAVNPRAVRTFASFPISSLSNLTHSDLVDMGIFSAEIREKMLSDIRAIANMSDEERKAAKEEAKRLDATETRESRQKRQAADVSTSARTEVTETAETEQQDSGNSSTEAPNGGVLHKARLQANAARARAAKLRAKAWKAAVGDITGWDLSKLQAPTKRLTDSWDETAVATSAKRGWEAVRVKSAKRGSDEKEGTRDGMEGDGKGG